MNLADGDSIPYAQSTARDDGDPPIEIMELFLGPYHGV